ncbi:MAG: tetratricopeptide repeat protein [Micropepsaceae bacterium]
MNKPQPVNTPASAQRMSPAQALQLAAQHQQSGRPAQAEGVLRQLLQQRPNDAEALHQLAILAYQAGKMPLAVQLIERAIGVNPNVHVYHANIAEMYRRLDQPQKAIEHGKRAIALKADAPDAHNNLGIAHFDLADYETAIRCYEQAIALRPRFAEAISNRANALRQMKRYEEAEGEYRRSLAINPSYAEAHNNLGSVLRDLERHEEAETAYRRAVDLKPMYIEALNNLILAQKELKKYDEAIATAQKVLGLDPNNADAHCYLGGVYVDQKKPEPALEALRKSLTFKPDKPETHNMVGRALFDMNEPAKAVEAYKRAIALKPDFADPYNNMGNVLKELGRFEEALVSFDTAISLQPDTIGVYVNLSDAKKFRDGDDKHLRAIEGFLSKFDTLKDEDRMHAGFAAAKAYDDLKRYELGFPYLIRANALKRKSIGYDEPTVLKLFERIRETFTPELVSAKAGSGFATQKPIFVLGMPRSGTTLVEQILASHSRVTGAGELKDMSDTINLVRSSDGNQAAYPEFMPVLSPQELAKIGEVYAAKLDRHAPGAERITDKMPSNFYFLGLIHLALPGAKVIHTNRNPVDTCVSCFSKLFAGEQSQTYDLAELGRYYRAYHGLMAHWRAVLPPGAFLDVQYEEVVADTEGQARRILDHCGLEWSPQVLDFHRTERPVKTASARQVRQPIYGSSVQRWRNYEKFLGPLLDELGDLS